MKRVGATGVSKTYDGMVILSGTAGVRRSYRLDDGLPGMGCPKIAFDPVVIEFSPWRESLPARSGS